MNSEILNGLRVLDLTRVLAGPYATRILADFGAEVIKVQSRKIAAGTEDYTSRYFSTWNRNKRSITLDLGYGEARELFLRLTSFSDVVIENFSPRVMANWGLTYEMLQKVNPDLIMVSMSAMGQIGPWKNFMAFGPTIQAFSGFSFLSSFKNEEPLGVGFSYADIIAGLYAAVAVLSALEYREEQGTGLFIDLSEYEAMCTVLGPSFLELFANKTEVSAQGNFSDYLPAAPYGCYRCRGKDSWCVIGVWNDSEWNALCTVLGFPEWRQNERFSSVLKRKEYQKELDMMIERSTVHYDAEELVLLLQKEGVPAGVIQNAEDLAHDPHLAARSFFVPLEHPILGETISDGSPIKGIGLIRKHWKASPTLGQDNRYVFSELLGLSEEEYSSYVERGIIG